MTTVYFATNRDDSARPGTFTSEPVDPADPSKVVYATAEVSDIDLTEENSGTIASPFTDRNRGSFAANVGTKIAGSGKNLLVFIHGYNNAFEDAIRRAAFNREWLAASGRAGADTTVVAFSWPSYANPLWYDDDWKHTDLSGRHIAAFLTEMAALRAKLKQSRPGARTFLLTHSMGAHALAAGIEARTAAGTPAAPIFDEAILAAADEVDNAFVHRVGLSGLTELAGRISIYYSENDAVLRMSRIANANNRLGLNGPEGKSDQQICPPATFRSVDCTDVFDFPLQPPQTTHEYYRRSKTVRADIAALLNGDVVAPGQSALKAYPVRVA